MRYLQARLAELYRAARARGRRAGHAHALVVVTMAVTGWGRITALPATYAGACALLGRLGDAGVRPDVADG